MALQSIVDAIINQGGTVFILSKAITPPKKDFLKLDLI